MSMNVTQKHMRTTAQAGWLAARSSRQRGSMEGRLLVLLGVVLLLSIGLIAWFSEPPGPAEGGMEPQQASGTSVE
ncbi:MAG: hypothetical protein E2O52_03420 [Gammaproteobacteria bacterium]|nr:MAG: hypothetical protein E2O52_03420 [Gammaproteobacteria bacterium]